MKDIFAENKCKCIDKYKTNYFTYKCDRKLLINLSQHFIMTPEFQRNIKTDKIKSIFKESVENTIKASIDSMLFCMSDKVNWLHNDQIKELILNNIRFQLYHEKNPNFILKCLIFRDLMTEREYDSIHCRD